VDDRLTTAAGLAEVSTGIIHIYGQHEYQDLLNPRQHMKILEDYAGISRDRVERCHDDYTRARERLEALHAQIRAAADEREYLEDCMEELAAMPLEEGLEDRLSTELQTSRRAAELRDSAQALVDMLYSGTPSMNDLGGQARQLLSRIAQYDPALEPLVQGMEGIMAQLGEIDAGLRRRLDAYEIDPGHAQLLEDRLHALRDLKRKHRTDEAGLIRLGVEIGEKLALLDASEQSTIAAGALVTEALDRYRDAVKTFLAARARAAAKLSKAITKDLAELGMPGTDFRVEQTEPKDLGWIFLEQDARAVSPGALLKGEFLVSTNVGQNVLPLARIASGGELSRIMLAIKARQNTSTEATLIFDEVDAGISGQTAIAIAAKLKDLSMNAQAIVVTHLHQVACVADAHFVITKTVRGRTTSSTLGRLTGSDRVMELARMMGGDSPSLTVIEHARELVGAHEAGRSREH
jgi:DNA repair protein RecN (Recombination protein N)